MGIPRSGFREVEPVGILTVFAPLGAGVVILERFISPK
jgi:hypothetical protein